jgi:glyoxylase-like metal-dependent hydrolase (beta-lactamase superfamily II)
MGGFKIGGLQIDRVEELYGAMFPMGSFFTGFPEDVVEREAQWIVPNHVEPTSGMMIASSHSWVVRTSHHTVLIDTGVGNDKSRPIPPFNELQTPYIERLAAIGLTPDDIDFVICTHLHIDHIGWNTRLENGRWVPTFPKARYIFGRKEYEYSAAIAASEGPTGKTNNGVDVYYKDSILPIVEAGKAELVDDGYTLDDNLSMEAAHGHSPGQMLIRVKDAGKTGIFCGDVIHSVLQVRYPDVNSNFCEDPVQAAATRHRVLSECADHGHLLLPAHLGNPHFGRISRADNAFRFHPGQD